MIKIEHIDVMGWEHAIRGMRNPMNSWEKSDSDWTGECHHRTGMVFEVGKNDLDLMRKLFKGGTEHRKFMRMIVVYMDITAPFYWWKEFDTYKIGTVANSCSTIHKIHSKKFTTDDFSTEHLTTNEPIPCSVLSGMGFLQGLVGALNKSRSMYLETKDKKWWWQLIQLLPSSYNQKRTVMMNYEVASTIIRQRTGHKLDEWNILVKELHNLPYLDEIMGEC